jgi:hypothetical protein
MQDIGGSIPRGSTTLLTLPTQNAFVCKCHSDLFPGRKVRVVLTFACGLKSVFYNQ